MLSSTALVRRLCYISPRFPSLSMVFEQNEILGLIDSGVDVQVVVCRKPSRRDWRELHSFARPIVPRAVYPDLRRLPVGLLRAARYPGKLARCFWWCLSSARNPLAFPKIFGALVVALMALSHDEIYSVDWIHADFGQHSATVALFLSAVLNRPFSFKVHAFDIFDRHPLRADTLRCRKLKSAQIVFSVHEFGRRWLAQTGEIDFSKTIVNRVAVRTREFSPLPEASTSRRFVALGRLVRKKGFDVLIRATAMLAARGVPVEVDIYGSGPEKEALHALIEEFDLDQRVCLRGPYTNESLPDMLADCVALVAPSVRDPWGDMDGVPTVIYEAMVLARPVIASALSGIPEVVHQELNGLLVTPGSAPELAEAMDRLLRDPVLAATLGRAGRTFVVQEHDNTITAERLLRAFRS